MTAADERSRRSAFAAFFSAHYSSTMRMVSALEGGRGRSGDVDDAVQAAMAELYTQWDVVANPAAWVRTVATNYLRRTSLRNKRLYTLSESVVQRSAESAPAADHVLLDREWATQLLETLPATQRAVMTGVFEGLTTSEIAESLGKTPETVRKNLQLARGRLRREIAAQEAE